MKNTHRKDRKLYVFDYILTPSKLENSAILCEGEHILAIGGLSAFNKDSVMTVYAFENAYAAAGFVDTHIHGAGGFDSSAVLQSPKTLEDMSLLLASKGVTSFVPTIVADTPEKMLANLAALVEAVGRPMPGADCVGINIEGPFINRSKSGAQYQNAIIDIDLGFARELLACGGKAVKLMTFAPELDNATALIETLCEHGVMPSMGHSVADENATLRAIDAGARHCTHLFNGMPPLHQREMSLTNVALTDNRVTVELIIDGRHIDPRMVDLACRCKPKNKIVGISDCTMAAGMPNGTYHIGPTHIQVADGYSNADGILAGTTTLLDTGWHCLMSYGHLLETQAAQAVSLNAAASVGLSDRGKIIPRQRADIAVFERGTNRPLMTICKGKIVFNSGDNYTVEEGNV